MTEELKELANYLAGKITTSGIKDVTLPYCKDCNWVFQIDGLAERKKDKYGFEGICGFDIRMNQVHRSNATNQNTSMRIEIIEWSYSSGHAVHKVKISIRDSVKKRDRLVQEIIDAYKQIAKEHDYEC